MLDTVVISGEYVCYSVVYGTLVGVFIVMWSELLMTSAISPLWSSVYECHKVECAFTSMVRTECGMFLGAICSVVCLCLLFCSAWMGCLKEVYRCLLL